MCVLDRHVRILYEFMFFISNERLGDLAWDRSGNDRSGGEWSGTGRVGTGRSGMGGLNRSSRVGSGGDKSGEDETGLVGEGLVGNGSVAKKVAADPSSFNWLGYQFQSAVISKQFKPNTYTFLPNTCKYVYRSFLTVSKPH
jgi:hypothetical protein